MQQRFVLESPPFTVSTRPHRRHARLVSPQSFPHLWKKLWKFAGSASRRKVHRSSHPRRCASRNEPLGPNPLACRNQGESHSFYTWFKPTSFVAEETRRHRAGTERAVQGLADQALLGRHQRGDGRGAGRATWPSISSPSRRPTRRRFRSSPDETAALEASRVPSDAPGPAGLNPRYTFDTFIVGSIESVRARRVPRGRGSAVALVQPAVHLRRRGSRQDAPDARGRAVRAAARSQPEADLHLVRAVHERDDQRGPLRSRHRFPRALSDASTSCSSTTSSSSPARKARRPSSSTRSTRCTIRRSRSSSAATVRRTRFRRSKSACDRGSSGG